MQQANHRIPPKGRTLVGKKILTKVNLEVLVAPAESNSIKTRKRTYRIRCHYRPSQGERSSSMLFHNQQEVLRRGAIAVSGLRRGALTRPMLCGPSGPAGAGTIRQAGLHGRAQPLDHSPARTSRIWLQRRQGCLKER